MIQKASKRHGIMASVTQRSWGLEVGILRSAHSALLTSLVTYGLAAIGGTTYEGILDRLEVQKNEHLGTPHYRRLEVGALGNTLCGCGRHVSPQSLYSTVRDCHRPSSPHP